MFELYLNWNESNRIRFILIKISSYENRLFIVYSFDYDNKKFN